MPPVDIPDRCSPAPTSSWLALETAPEMTSAPVAAPTRGPRIRLHISRGERRGSGAATAAETCDNGAAAETCDNGAAAETSGAATAARTGTGTPSSAGAHATSATVTTAPAAARMTNGAPSPACCASAPESAGPSITPAEE